MARYNDVIDEKRVSRRGFIKGATVTALAAGAAATGQNLLQNEIPPQPIISSAPITQPVQSAVSPTISQNREANLLSEIANLHAENLRLQTELTTHQQQLLNLESVNQTEASTSDALTVELENANHQIGLLAGLVGLYEQLDQVEIEKIFDKGLTAVSSNFANLLDDLPSLEQGLSLGQLALDDFESQLPILQNGRTWLTHHFQQLNARFLAVQTILQESVERIGPLFDMLQEWFASVKKWLPFNLGERATQIMTNITALILETPNTINGMATNIAEPLDVWLSNDDSDHPIQLNMVKPIREQIITKTSTAVAKTHQLNTAYTTELQQPMKTAVDRQKILRQLISDYREQHQL
ncbi:MAG: twin-arginine translocation signal domain-containing protein [Chloroflexota bacterium]